MKYIKNFPKTTSNLPQISINEPQSNKIIHKKKVFVFTNFYFATKKFFLIKRTTERVFIFLFQSVRQKKRHKLKRKKKFLKKTQKITEKSLTCCAAFAIILYFFFRRNFSTRSGIEDVMRVIAWFNVMSLTRKMK